ncbi:acyltransferase family protein [Mesobacillus harenae]|uniref:acyltransferase family protein n=1 Tax=Mesobacillus harenae TaxID=2213203 RepID=UPI00158004BD|nr:acyltransferase family protein [Mesobacillus harenae]
MKQRDYYFDNAKFILIFLVVFGHLLQTFIKDHQFMSNLYKVIYTFHMPAFILVSGYFAKGYNKTGYIPKIAKKLIFPYLLFQMIYSVFYYYLFNKSQLVIDPLNPHWSLWFLISLFCWNIMLLIFARFNSKGSLAAALLIGLGIGYIDWISNYLSLSRTFVFFPLFLLGYFMNKEHFQQITKPAFKLFAGLIFVFVFTGFYLNPDINYKWLLGSKPYAELGAAALPALLNRLGFYLLSLVMVLSFFAFVPKRQYYFTHLGKNTLYVYLLHGFFVRMFRESHVQNYFKDPETLLFLAVLSLFLTMILSSKTATLFTQPLIELEASRLRRFTARIAARMNVNQT